MRTVLAVAALLSVFLGAFATASAGSNGTVADVSGIQKPLKGAGGAAPVSGQNNRIDKSQTSSAAGAPTGDTGNRFDKGQAGSGSTTIPSTDGTFQSGLNAGGRGNTQPCSTFYLTIGEQHTKTSSCNKPIGGTIHR